MKMPTESDEFKVGDAVYYDEANEIGWITQIKRRANNEPVYYIDYAQFKDPSRPRCGGSGPIWRPGFPKPVTDPADVLFVAANKRRKEIERLKDALKIAEAEFAALCKSIDILKGK